jgi:hypothetical protein
MALPFEIGIWQTNFRAFRVGLARGFTFIVTLHGLIILTVITPRLISDQVKGGEQRKH